MDTKPKVYVETTVVSDATALPTRVLVQAGRQLVTREWWNTAIRVRASAPRKCYRKEAAYDYRETIRFHS